MKLTIGDMEMEGTIDELREWAELSGVEFPVNVEEPLKAGDYAKVVLNDGALEIGDIVRISEEVPAVYSFFAERMGDNEREAFNLDELVRATDEEVAEAKSKLERKRGDEKWAKIGRKPNEFKKGDIVKYTPSPDRIVHGLKDYSGITVEVTSVSGGSIGVSKPDFVCNGYGTMSTVEELTLITPVEARFDHE